jgi:hypothetical protein
VDHRSSCDDGNVKFATSVGHLESVGQQANEQLRLRESDIGWPLEELWVGSELLEADVTKYVPEPGAADLVVVAYLHLPEPDRTTVLRRVQDAVAPAGVLLVIGHDRSNLDHGYGGPQEPTVLTRPEEVAAILDDLVIERAERSFAGSTRPRGHAQRSISSSGLAAPSCGAPLRRFGDWQPR